MTFSYADMAPVYYPTPLDEYIVIDGIGPTRNSQSNDNTIDNGMPISTPYDYIANSSNNNYSIPTNQNAITPADFVDVDAILTDQYRKEGNQLGLYNYGSIAEPLRRYFNDQVAIYGYANGYYEDNYIYSNGQHSVSNYNGILAGAIYDFDGDTVPEMALFRIATEGVDEYSNKYIFMDMIRVFNGLPVVSDSVVLLTEQFYGESIECNVSIKQLDNKIRIYLNYVEKKEREEMYETKFVCYEFPNNLNLVCDMNLSMYEYDTIDPYIYLDQILDSGCTIRDNTEICRRSFLNDDPSMVPVFTIKRVNEKMKDGYADDYFEQMGFNYNMEEFTRLRYGYTTFIDRTK